MPIINKGVFDTDAAFLRQTGNDWPTAQVISTTDIAEGINQYFTNAKAILAISTGIVPGDIRAAGNLVANGLIIRNISVSDSVLVGSTSANTIVADSVTSNVWNKLYTSNVIETAGNLYFTNVRAVQAVTPVLTTANVVETTNQYFTNARAVTAVTPVLTTANVVENTNQYFTNSRAVSAITPVLTTANVVENTNQYFTNSRAVSAITPLLTTANVVENTSLYFSNARARAAFTAGKGIVIRGDGTIQNTGGSVNYNLDINGTTSGNILSTMSTMLTFPSVPTTDRFLLRSIHVVNISNETALVSGNILYATGNTAVFGNQIPVAEGGVLEFIDKPQIFQPGDKINLQGFDNSSTATSNILSAMFTYETYSTDPSFIGLGQTLTTNATNYQIYNSDQSSSIVESIKFVNLATTTNTAKLYWADANGVLRTHLAYNLAIPPNSSVDVLAQPKRINFKDTLYASIRDSTDMSVFVSARLSATYTISENTGNVVPGGTVSSVFTTTDTEGTTLYYTIE